MTWPTLCIAVAELARESIRLFAAGLGIQPINRPAVTGSRRAIPR